MKDGQGLGKGGARGIGRAKTSKLCLQRKWTGQLWTWVEGAVLWAGRRLWISSQGCGLLTLAEVDQSMVMCEREDAPLALALWLWKERTQRQGLTVRLWL